MDPPGAEYGPPRENDTNPRGKRPTFLDKFTYLPKVRYAPRSYVATHINWNRRMTLLDGRVEVGVESRSVLPPGKPKGQSQVAALEREVDLGCTAETLRKVIEDLRLQQEAVTIIGWGKARLLSFQETALTTDPGIHDYMNVFLFNYARENANFGPSAMLGMERLFVANHMYHWARKERVRCRELHNTMYDEFFDEAMHPDCFGRPSYQS